MPLRALLPRPFGNKMWPLCCEVVAAGKAIINRMETEHPTMQCLPQKLAAAAQHRLPRHVPEPAPSPRVAIDATSTAEPTGGVEWRRPTISNAPRRAIFHIGQHDTATGSGLLFGSSNYLASAAVAMPASADAKDKLTVTAPKPACCSQRSAAKEI